VVTLLEFRLIHSFFLDVLGQHFEYPVPIPEQIQRALQDGDLPTEELPPIETALTWLDLLDAGISPQRLRRYGKEHRIEEPASRALLRFWASRGTSSPENRYKVDWLVTHHFRVRAEEQEQPVGWVKSELRALFEGIPFPPLGPEAQTFLEEIPPLLDEVRYLGTLSQIPDSRVLDRGRELKAQLGRDFCNPAVLAAIVNYNLVFGKKFDELLEQPLTVSRPAGDTHPEVDLGQLIESLRNDYPSNTGVISQLSGLTRRQPAEKGTAPAERGLTLLLEQQLECIGIDPARELSKLRGRIRELAKKMMQDAHVRSIRICGSSLSLDTWEADSLRSLTGKREENLQGAFARSVSRAIAFLVRIYEELYAYETKKGAGNLEWMKHHAALFYLLYEGRGHQAVLQQLALLHRKGGFPELSQQLVSTAEKLEANLARLKDLF
jgi:hypothetical protein